MSGAFIPIFPHGSEFSDLVSHVIDLGPSRVDSQLHGSSYCEAGKWKLSQRERHPPVSSQAKLCPSPSSVPLWLDQG